MKNSVSEVESSVSVDSLRAEVRELRAAVAGLEAKLSELEESEEECQEDPWAVWPYCWFTSGWKYTHERFHSFQLERRRRALERYNEKMRQLVESEAHVLHLVQ